MSKIWDFLNQEINIKSFFGKAQVRIKLPIPFISYEIPLNEVVISSQTIDTRIARLSEIKNELESAIEAVESLQNEAQQNKEEVGKLQERIQELEEDKSTAENLLQLPQDSVIRLIDRATSKGKNKGRIEGLLIGIITGVISSLVVWVLTEKVLIVNSEDSGPELKSPISIPVESDKDINQDK
ncbi:MAG: hypothetical protein AAF572_13725 [Cyanobacteria bacterium P01_B01_bin.77]